MIYKCKMPTRPKSKTFFNLKLSRIRDIAMHSVSWFLQETWEGGMITHGTPVVGTLRRRLYPCVVSVRGRRHDGNWSTSHSLAPANDRPLRARSSVQQKDVTIVVGKAIYIHDVLLL